jgi:hypothetical protein
MFQTSTPMQYFWYQIALMISVDINSLEAFNWKIALLVVWVLVYMCMIKGITSSGKVSSHELLLSVPCAVLETLCQVIKTTSYSST